AGGVIEEGRVANRIHTLREKVSLDPICTCVHQAEQVLGAGRILDQRHRVGHNCAAHLPSIRRRRGIVGETESSSQSVEEIKNIRTADALQITTPWGKPPAADAKD